MKIGIDLDEVLAGFFESFIKYHNKNYGTALRREMLRDYDISKILGIDYDALEPRLEDFYKSEEFKNIRPIEGAIESIPEIREGNELFIVTGRPSRFEKDTLGWINKHFPETFKEVHFSDYDSVYPNEMDKGKNCKKLGLKFFIEDNLVYAAQCSKNGTRVLLFDAPWNKCSDELESQHRFIRVFSWRDISNTIKMFSTF